MGVIKKLTKQQFEEMKENALKPPKCHKCGRNPDIIITLAEYGRRKIVVDCKYCSSKVEVNIPTEIFSNDKRLLTIHTEKGLAKAITEVLNAWG